ncbi:M1 family metallopeptidase [Streptomyces boncukensis]|uniref:Aminopeptidase N n=1 Tax=Streptomyces boncukensis TaxID=2711219 RepID=A0A6G4WWQ0_9ACTN|nr:M1 family metallopeptidase [Streptomyces boncukensis]NGO69538.1 M1 family metallopeptidase [Streptomyces boncukensis]
MACTASRIRRRCTTVAAVSATVLALVAASVPAPEPLGVGDRLFPGLGNPGYDVRAYDISFRYDGTPDRPLPARTRIDARVTARHLDRFHLDFAGGTVRGVRVNGLPAQHRRAGEDLVVTPGIPVRRHMPLRIDIRHTSPTEGVEHGAWVRTKDGLVMAAQPDAAHRAFPANDHPSDKARFTFRLTAPRGVTAVAGGTLVGRNPAGGGRITWTYRLARPMATELAQVSFGRSAVLRREGPHGLPVRDVVPRGQREQLEPWLARTPAQMAWLEQRLGRYPFENYGVLAAEAPLGFALETQTLSLFGRRFLTSPTYPSWYKQSVMVHELAHQWFGNSVTPRRWSDLWLSEGHATWYEWHYGAERGGFPVARRLRAAYRHSDAWRERYGPPAAPRVPAQGERPKVFSPVVYDGSALVLYALRQRIGEADFARLQRAWTARHRDGNATTADFIALAGEVSGQDLTGFLRAWLYGKKTPPMPGHPDWRSAPGGKSG